MNDEIMKKPNSQADDILDAPLVTRNGSSPEQSVSDFIDATLVKDPSARQNSQPAKKDDGEYLGFVVLAAIIIVLVFAGIGIKELFFTKHEKSSQPVAEVSAQTDSYREHPVDAPKEAVETAKGPSNVELIVMAKDAVRLRLKDPDTAKFKGVFVSAKSGNRIVCGTVNAKNGMGGYNGYEGFVSNGLPQATFLASDVSDFSNTWKEFCSG